MRLTSVGYSASGMLAASQPGGTVAAVGLAATMAVVFALDQVTGLPHVQHLYYLPIICAGISFGRLAGTATAAVAIALYHLANPHMLTWRYDESDVLQMAVFVAVGVVAAQLATDGRRLRHLAMTDDLTGLHNLRSFELELRRMVRAARVAGTPLSLLVVDVDRLKSLNDRHGHLAGAEAVRTVGRILGERVPRAGVACRYGGDEFVIALPDCAAPAALQVADAFRGAVQATAPVLGGVQFPRCTLSISIGLACRAFGAAGPAGSAADEDEESEALFREADAALYRAKDGGRNRVHASRDVRRDVRGIRLRPDSAGGFP